MAERSAASRSVEILNSGTNYTSPNTSNTKKSAYNLLTASTISPQDTLNINIFKVPDLSASALKVETNGAISLPLIGSVQVAGLTISQAENLITQRLSQYMQDPKVSVIRTDNAITKRVTVEGEVRTPGVFPIKGNLSFLQAIAMAQGLTEMGNSQSVLFFRDGTQHSINLDLVRTGQIPDPVLRGDDRIVVIKDASKVRKKNIIEAIPNILSPISVLGGFL